MFKANALTDFNHRRVDDNQLEVQSELASTSRFEQSAEARLHAQAFGSQRSENRYLVTSQPVDGHSQEVTYADDWEDDLSEQRHDYSYEKTPVRALDSSFSDRIEKVDRIFIEAMGRMALPVCRIGLGIIFFWFGFLKFVDGMSPAQALVEATIVEMSGLVGLSGPPTGLFVFILAVWEVSIGVGFLANRHRRLVLVMLFLQLPGTMLPIVLLPAEVWHSFPLGLTLEGQYILKNLVLVGSAFALGSQIRLEDYKQAQYEDSLDDEWVDEDSLDERVDEDSLGYRYEWPLRPG